MSSLSQIEADRRNAKKSTGPRTAQGKAESRLNALQTGIYAQSMIIQGEDPAQLEALTCDYLRQYQPANATERCLMDILVDCEWKLRRFRTIEARIFEMKFDDLDPDYVEEEHWVAEAYDRGDSTFARLQRRIDSTHRILLRTLTALARAQANRRAQQPEDALSASGIAAPPALRSAADPASNQPSAPGIGFVPSIPDEPRPAACLPPSAAPHIPADCPAQ